MNKNHIPKLLSGIVILLFSQPSNAQVPYSYPPAPPVPATPPSYGYVAPGYVAPIAPPQGVAIIAPIGVAPGPNWVWAYHPNLGWGWHHPEHGWRHR